MVLNARGDALAAFSGQFPSFWREGINTSRACIQILLKDYGRLVFKVLNAYRCQLFNIALFWTIRRTGKSFDRLRVTICKT